MVVWGSDGSGSRALFCQGEGHFSASLRHRYTALVITCYFADSVADGITKIDIAHADRKKSMMSHAAYRARFSVIGHDAVAILQPETCCYNLLCNHLRDQPYVKQSHPAQYTLDQFYRTQQLPTNYLPTTN